MMPVDVFLHDAYFYVDPVGRWVMIVWLFLFGAVIGSFLNVVVYRLPRGMSLLRPGSQCPACGHPIRWYDNVPVVAWFWLGGRCRDCHARISARYPLVEAIVGLSGALVGWVAFAAITPAEDIPIEEQWFTFSVATYVLHFLLVCVLIAAALMEFDGHRPPAGMLCLALIVGFAVGSIWPAARLLPVEQGQSWRGVYDGTAGLLAALVLGAIAWPTCVAGANKSDIQAGVAMLLEFALVGAYLGAREASILIATSALGYVAARVIARRRQPAEHIGWAATLAAITLVGIVAWPPLREAWPSLAQRDDLTVEVLAGGVVALVSVVRAVGLIRPPSLSI